jgi:hydrogenase maturation protease
VRTLVAGFGNALRADDGFGVEVVRRLAEQAPRPGVELMDVGTAGIRLAQELLSPCDRLIVVDAMARGGAPGTIYVERVDAVEPPAAVDMHLAVPARALGLAQALGGMPAEVFIVGCEPAEIDELSTALTPVVAAAIPAAIAQIDRLLASAPDGGARHRADPVVTLARRDEILQIMFWLQAEGLGPEVAAADVLRFIEDATAVRATLDRLVDDGLAEAIATPGGPRYRLTVTGVHEGRRRFLDEFEPYLARAGHAECGTADCACHAGGECQNR